MTKRPAQRIGDLQLKILRVLWQRPDISVRDVYGELGAEGKWAYTTIATMLKKMEARKLVSHELVDRKFVYRAAIREDDVARNMTAHLIERVFEGSLADMVTHLLQTREISRTELDELEKLIAEKKKKGRK
jgi:BlaI family transcriptional regulator, penicillinase repressor